LLLLDADAIIGLHRLGVWEHIVKSHQINIPFHRILRTIILRKEVYYYEDEKGMPHPIDLIKDIGATINEVSCLAEELLSFANKFDRVFPPLKPWLCLSYLPKEYLLKIF
jgi:hypothetical protein